MRVCLGGAFNPLHKGHKALITKACVTAGPNGLVFIGITTGKMLATKQNIKPFEEREKTVKAYLVKEGFIDRCMIKPITDRYGPSIQGDFDVIVVTPETLSTAHEINMKRRELGKTPLQIIQIPLVLAEDGCPIRSSRIRNHEIDVDGHVIREN
jgi:pantetheine-phosphate adenylyltransferase